MWGRASSIDDGSIVAGIGGADEELQRVHVLRQQRLLLRDIRLRLRKDQLRLVEVKPRRDPALAASRA